MKSYLINGGLIIIFLLNYEFSIGQLSQNNSKTNGIFDDLFKKNQSILILSDKENANKKIEANIFIKVIADKTSCYKGEPLLLTYKLYTALKSNSTISSLPFFGISNSYLLQANDPVTTEDLNDKTFKVFTLLKAQIIPAKYGLLQMTPLTLTDTIHFQKSGNAAEITFVKEIKSPDIPINIIHFKNPFINTDTMWSGVASMNVFVNKDSLPKNENGYLNISFRGTGEIDSIKKPTLVFGKNITAYNATESIVMNAKVYPLQGKKTFQIPFVLNTDSSAEIPAIKFIYFNTDTKKTNTLISKSIKIFAVKAYTVNKLPDKTGILTIFKLIIFALIIIVGLVLYFLYKVLKKIKQQKLEKTRRLKVNEEIIKQKLLVEQEKVNKFWQQFQSLKDVQDDTLFYSTLNMLMLQQLKDKFGITDFSELRSALKDKAMFHQMKQLHEILHINLYSPIATNENKKSAYDAAASIFKYIADYN